MYFHCPATLEPMPRPQNLNPMSTFDPSKPGKLYDQLNDKVFDWNPEQWAIWDTYASPPDSDGIVSWDGLMIAGWLPAS